MKKSAFISDIIFAFLAIFLPVLCLFRYLKWPLGLSVPLSALGGAFAAALTFLYLRTKCEKLRIKTEGLAARDKLLLRLALCDEAALSEIFSEYEKRNASGEESENFFLFTFAPLSPDALLPVLKAGSGLPKTLYCNSLSPEAEELCERFEIRTVTADGVYEILKDAENVPELPERELPKKRFKDKPKKWFQKRNSRRFLTAGGFVLAASLITPFPRYYLIFGCALVLSAVFIRVFGYR